MLVGFTPICLCFRCDRIPEGRVPPQSIPDGRFEVKIAGNPSLYVPGQVYTGRFLVIYL